MLTNQQKYTLHMYLGYSWQMSNIYDNPNRDLSSVLTQVGEDAVLQSMVEDLLTEIASIDAKLSATETLDLIGIKQVDKGDVIFKDDKGSDATLAALSHLGRKKVNQLSILLGIRIQTDYFGTAGYQYA